MTFTHKVTGRASSQRDPLARTPTRGPSGDGVSDTRQMAQLSSRDLTPPNSGGSPGRPWGPLLCEGASPLTPPPRGACL